MRADLRIGISGWNYPGWRRNFYPEGLVQKRELEYASRRFNSIEINGSFYSLQSLKSYRSWYEQSPEGFVFSVKGGRFITHMKKLIDVEKPLANFLASGVLALEEKLGPILWQFPPVLKFIPERFERFLELLPKDTFEAAELAREQDRIPPGESFTEPKVRRKLRHAFEIRHDSFMDPAFVGLLRKHDVALVFADTAKKWPYLEDLTSDFVYVRLHGSEKLYVSGYSDPELDWWADRVRIWQKGDQAEDAACVTSANRTGKLKARDVYVYFDNDAKVHAPFDALALMQRLRVQENSKFEEFEKKKSA